MIIRPAHANELTAIIQLMKSSLGESMIPKSEKLWQWKHEENPFGASYVLVAEEYGELIGLRAFMQWRWQWKDKTYKAIRAVDTATHPAHQGKGIFKKLTLQQLELCKADGVDFVFNTPNKQSRPGYLKMGWEQQGRMPLKLKLLRPINLVLEKFRKKPNKTIQRFIDPTPEVDWSVVLLLTDKIVNPTVQSIFTPINKDYIKWRYADNPLFNYTFFTNGSDYIAFGRIKQQGQLNELRITDFTPLKSFTRHAKNNFYKQVSAFCKEHHIHFVSISGQPYQFYKEWFGWMGIIPVKNLGPIVTLRNINADEIFPQLMQQENWFYSLGDMELF
jgi:GNAT superfamily N-acetyltransferase